jgi:hypothetical protein
VTVRNFRVAAFLAGALAAAPLSATVRITIVNANDPGVGFNDPTAADPVGGNTGTTLGQQRLNAFQKAAELWGALLDSDVEIRIKASFEPLDCTATTGTLGAAGPATSVQGFTNAPLPQTWYVVALANKLAGRDLAPSAPGHIIAQFNSKVGTAGCLETSQWYYGLDNQHGAKIDLVSVLLHEFGHGLGFLTLVDPQSGAEFLNGPDVFEKHVLDTSTGKHWDALTPAERVASAIRTGAVVWDSPKVTAAVPVTLRGKPLLTVTAPASAAGDLPVGTADFGATLTTDGVSGDLAAATDAANADGPATTDACTALDNSGEVAGKIALVDRGTCTFVVKALTTQAAGATGLVIANNVSDTDALAMSGTDPTVTIPVVSVTQADGATLRTNLAAGLAVGLRLDPDHLSGADASRRMLLYAPDPVEPGSSTSHWDTSAYPHLLMQPNSAADLAHAVDLTLPLLQDIGWESTPAGEPPDTRDAVHRVPRETATRDVGPRP